MRINVRCLCAVVFCAFLFCVPSAAFGQITDDWTLDSPPNSFQLVAVKYVTASSLEFTLKNISGKSVIEFRVSAPNGDMTGLDAFTNGVGVVAPDAATFAHFGESVFVIKGQSVKRLRIEAIVYSDGTFAGSPKALSQVEDGMLGAALENKRISDHLAASPDPGIGGLDGAAEKIGTTLPGTEKEAAASVHGIALSGIPQSYIDEHLSHPSFSFLMGLRAARQNTLWEMDKVREGGRSEVSMPRAQQARALKIQLSATADLAQKYRSLADTHVLYIRAFKGWAHGN